MLIQPRPTHTHSSTDRERKGKIKGGGYILCIHIYLFTKNTYEREREREREKEVESLEPPKTRGTHVVSSLGVYSGLFSSVRSCSATLAPRAIIQGTNGVFSDKVHAAGSVDIARPKPLYLPIGSKVAASACIYCTCAIFSSGRACPIAWPRCSISDNSAGSEKISRKFCTWER